MKGTSKIAILSPRIREELNQRLNMGQSQTSLAQWLNSFPEVQSALQEHFNGEPIKQQNIANWKKSGFHNWKLCQDAIQFTQDSLPEELNDAALEKMSSKLIRCLQIRYAALASSLPPLSEDPQSELRLLGTLCENVTALRR